MQFELVGAQFVEWEPGNGTHYRILVARNPAGGFNWLWIPEANPVAGGWASQEVGGELRVSMGRIAASDRFAIRAMVDQVRR